MQTRLNDPSDDEQGIVTLAREAARHSSVRLTMETYRHGKGVTGTPGEHINSEQNPPEPPPA